MITFSTSKIKIISLTRLIHHEADIASNNIDVIDIALDDDEEYSVEVCEVEKETH